MLIALVALNLGWPLAGAQAQQSPFDECEKRFAAEPLNQESVRCFSVVAGEGLGEEAARRLDRLRADHPDNPWLPLYLGHLIYRSSSGPEEPYREALRISQRLGDAEAEVEARLALTRLFAFLQRPEEADEMLDMAARIAEETGDPGLRAKVSIRQAFQIRYQGKDLESAFDLLDRVEPDVFPDGQIDLQRSWLDARALVSYGLGRNDEALACKQRQLAIALEAGNLNWEAEARYGIATLHLTTELPGPDTRKKARRRFEEALTTAQAAKHIGIEGRAHLQLGTLLDGEEGRRHLQACLEIAWDLGDPKLLNQCREALAANLATENPQEANQLIDQALAAAREANDLWAMAYGAAERLHVRWTTLERSEAIADSLEVIDALEALRELQSSGSGRAGLMTLLSEVYYWLSGQLLVAIEGTRPETVGRRSTDHRDDLELAFKLFEQLRARVLLEALEAAGAAAAPAAAEPLIEELEVVLKRKVEIQRQLLDPDLAAQARDRANADLQIVESKEEGLRHSIEQASPSFAALRKPILASLEQVEQSLAENEALFSYQIALDKDLWGRFAGGAWLLVSTRNGTRSYRLADDRADLEPGLDLLLGLQDPGNAEQGLSRLYRTLLRDALLDLPASIERLVIVPDGGLHRLPFALLPSAEDAGPLITRYQISVVPSATLWRRWKNHGLPASEIPALALADPVLAGRRLPPLPHAREEGRTMVAALGGESLLLEGEEATERFLKNHELGRFGVLHFGAHAEIDDLVPERSAVLLAPGAADEDGWLQPREIVDLDLDGRVVVLASCDSAAGQVLRGEGVMSLARAFFQAGSPVVVASLWPLPDDWSAAIFKEFYRRLAAGGSIARALAEAQREMLRRGAPARAWAGLVALGDGDLVPFPGGLERPLSRRWIAGVLLVLLALLGLLLRRRAV